MTMIDNQKLIDALDETYPDASCELVFSNSFECLIAVSLSAQTTDASVNKVTPALFASFPTPFDLAKAPQAEVEDIIHSLGLYRTKAKNIINLSKALAERFGGEVPNSKKELTTLPGVGIKTANVVLAECYRVPAIAVDTHVTRVSKRLGLAKETDSPEEIEKKLERRFPKEKWIRLHHQLIHHGRRICHAQSPACDICPLRDQCKEAKKRVSTIGK